MSRAMISRKPTTRVFPVFSVSLLLLSVVAHAGACSGSHRVRDRDDGQAGNGGSGGTGGDADTAGSAGSAGTGGNDSGLCQGSSGSPTATKGCGCDADCDPGERCAPETAQPQPGPPGGMCVRLCDIDGTCPAGLGCVELESGNPTTGSCFAYCGGTSDCRPGYVCGPLTVGSFSLLTDPPPGNFCVPFCQSDSDCPHTGSCNRSSGSCNDPEDSGEPIGGPCARAADCRGQICYPEQPGGSWSDGYCMTWCSVSKQGCPQGSACGQRQEGDWGLCFMTCTSVSDCRPGYACLLDPDANARVCVPTA
jgi:hypothetical protein